MRCPSCDKPNPADAERCSFCGAHQQSVNVEDVTLLSGSADLGEPLQPASADSDTTLIADAADLQPEVVFGRYEVLGELGEGGMGRVLRVRDRVVNEEMALKTISLQVASDPKFTERFRNELKLARKIAHRNVCRMFDLNEFEGSQFITMEYVPGKDLKQVIRSAGKLPVERALEIFSGLCRGLAEAHRLGIVHRDLKPQNVIIDRDGEPRILDFGLAVSASTSGLTHVGTLIGTPHYMSPEQVDGREADARADLYSLGVVLFEMMTGVTPFVGDNPLAIALKHKTDTPPDPCTLEPDLPAGVGQIITKCMKKDREHRYASAEELLTALTAVLKGEAEVITAPSFLEAEPEEVPATSAIPFSGREEELSRLLALLDKALDGQAQVALIAGEPGSGKSTLAGEFSRRAQEADADLVVATGRCPPSIDAGAPYSPFRELIELLTGDVEARYEVGAMSRERALRLWNLLPHSVQALSDHGIGLLDTFLPSDGLLRRCRQHDKGRGSWYPRLKELKKSSAEQPATIKESEVLSQYTRVVQEITRQTPVLLVLEDLHWVDSGSVNLLLHLMQKVGGSRLLVLGTYRPEEVALGRGGERHPLERLINEFKRDFGDVVLDLAQARSRAFLDSYLDAHLNRFDEGFREALFRQTKGHALFTVELLRDLQEMGTLHKDDQGYWVASPDLDWDALPMRAEGVIGERIARLPQELREILDLACVEGETFTAELVARVLGSDEREVVRQLSNELDRQHRLVKASGSRRLGRQRLSIYRFHHVLMQKYLYQQLDEVERSYKHEDVGATLEELYGDQSGQVAAELAQHFELAGDDEKAVHYHQIAGASAIQLSAYVEGLVHFEKGLARLDSLPESTERHEQELALRSRHGAALIAARGFASDEVEATYRRAGRLCKELGETPLPIRWGTWMFAIVRGVRETTEELRPGFSELAESDDPFNSVVANTALGMEALLVGRFARSVRHMMVAKERYDPGMHEELMQGYGEDLGLLAQFYIVWSSVITGNFDTALAEFHAARALAYEFETSYEVATALAFATTLSKERGEPERAREYAVELKKLCAEQGFPFWLALGMCCHGWTEVLQGAVDEGIQEIEHGMQIWDSTGARVPVGFVISYLIDGCLVARRIEDGLAQVAKALNLSAQTEYSFYDAEIHRLEGELLLASGDEKGAEASFRKALRIARDQEAHSLELRAGVSLGRFLHERKRSDEARSLVSDAYGKLTEGFETPHPMAAKAFLEELG